MPTRNPNAREYLTSSMEDDTIPSLILSVLQANEGKLITKRLATACEDLGIEDVRIVRQYGWTKLLWGDDVRGMILARQEKNAYVDSAWTVKENGAYFGALQKRNAERRELLDGDKPEVLTDLAREYNQALEALGAAKKALESALEGHFRTISIWNLVQDYDLKD